MAICLVLVNMNNFTKCVREGIWKDFYKEDDKNKEITMQVM